MKVEKTYKYPGANKDGSTKKIKREYIRNDTLLNDDKRIEILKDYETGLTKVKLMEMYKIYGVDSYFKLNKCLKEARKIKQERDVIEYKIELEEESDDSDDSEYYKEEEERMIDGTYEEPEERMIDGTYEEPEDFRNKILTEEDKRLMREEVNKPVEMIYIKRRIITGEEDKEHVVLDDLITFLENVNKDELPVILERVYSALKKLETN